MEGEGVLDFERRGVREAMGEEEGVSTMALLEAVDVREGRIGEEEAVEDPGAPDVLESSGEVEEEGEWDRLRTAPGVIEGEREVEVLGGEEREEEGLSPRPVLSRRRRRRSSPPAASARASAGPSLPP